MTASLQALHALILDGNLNEAARICGKLMAQQCKGCDVHKDGVYTIGEPKSAAVQQGVQPGWRAAFKDAVYADLAAADNQDVPLEDYPERILRVLDSLKHPTQQGLDAATLDALQEAESVLNSINMGKQHRVVQADGEVTYWQREEWCMWAAGEVLPKVTAALATQAKQGLDAQGDESDYQRGYRHGYNRRDAEVQGALL